MDADRIRHDAAVHDRQPVDLGHSRTFAGSNALRRRERAAGATAEITASTAQAPMAAVIVAQGI
ncbi:hypothetical protein ACWEO4_16280 [Streptomyces sp. NPDC004393]|uniref:hypothetical protein n=1 Tax=unclassified Streptomyces TaxID=2593676 RepID=UPI0033AF2282